MDYQEKLISIKDMLIEARDYAMQVLDEQESGILRISLKTKIEGLIKQLEFLSNTRSAAAPKHEFPPITNFMGEELVINSKPVITEEQLSPDEQRKKDFIQAIEDLEVIFLDTPTAKILESHSLPEHHLILRGVAKRAGIEDFRTARIDSIFVDLIKEAMKDKLKLSADQLKAEEDLEDESNS